MDSRRAVCISRPVFRHESRSSAPGPMTGPPSSSGGISPCRGDAMAPEVPGNGISHALFWGMTPSDACPGGTTWHGLSNAVRSEGGSHIVVVPHARASIPTGCDFAAIGGGVRYRVAGAGRRGCRQHGCCRQAYRDVFTASPAGLHPPSGTRQQKSENLICDGYNRIGTPGPLRPHVLAPFLLIRVQETTKPQGFKLTEAEQHHGHRLESLRPQGGL